MQSLWTSVSSFVRWADSLGSDHFCSDGILAEVCSPLPKVFKKVGQEYVHPGDRQNTILEEIIRWNTKKNQKTGSGWNAWLLVLPYCGRKKKSPESTRERECSLSPVTIGGAVVRGPLADGTLFSWLHSQHCLKPCWVGLLTSILWVGSPKLREVNAMLKSRQLTGTRTRTQSPGDS